MDYPNFPSIYDVSNVAMIPPIPDVHWTSQMAFHLCEAPIVLTSEKYAQYYKWHAEKGNYVIMDNGAAIGGTVTDEAIVEAARKVHADEIVVPDAMANSELTLKRARQFIRQYPGAAGTLMLVPQGTDLDSWQKSLHDLIGVAKTYGVPRYIIGIGKHMHARIQGGRGQLVSICQWEKLLCHLLGASDDPFADLDLLHNPAVRGLDTSLPFVMAQNNYKLLAEPIADGQWCLPPLEGRRPSLNFLKSSDMLGRVNLDTYLGWVAREHSRTAH